MLYIIARDSMTRTEYDTGIRVIDDPDRIRDLMTMLHRGSTATMFRTERAIPAGCLSAVR